MYELLTCYSNGSGFMEQGFPRLYPNVEEAVESARFRYGWLVRQHQRTLDFAVVRTSDKAVMVWIIAGHEVGPLESIAS